MIRLNKLFVVFAVMVALSALCVQAFGAAISVSVSPNRGTSNSVYIIDAVWTDSSTPPQLPTPNREQPSGPGMLVLKGFGNVVFGGIPMYPVEVETGRVKFRAVISGGLSMAIAENMRADYVQGGSHVYMPVLDSNPLPTNGYEYRMTADSSVRNRVPHASPNGVPVYYSPQLRAGTGDPLPGGGFQAVGTVEGYPWNFTASPPAAAEKPIVANVSFDVYSSSGLTFTVGLGGQQYLIDYGWIGPHTVQSVPFIGNIVIPTPMDPMNQWTFNDQDYLSCLPDRGETVDPLSVGPEEHANELTPDEGSGNSIFDFRVRYKNLAGLPPRPWMMWGSHTSGVVLYFGKVGDPDYDAFPMQMESGTDADGVYKFSFAPAGLAHFRTGSRSGDCYTSLEPGIYRYFFGTSDDSLETYFEDEGPSASRFVFCSQPNISQWGGMGGYDSTTGEGVWNPLDPRDARRVSGLGFLDRDGGRRYSSGRGLMPGIDERILWYDDTLLIDRVIRAPGNFEDSVTWEETDPPRFTWQYPYNCNEHPKVTCVIDMRNPDTGEYVDADGFPFNNSKYGFAKYWGTLLPFKRGVIPMLQGDCAINTRQTENVFRIVYRQLDGKAPIKSQIWISDGMGRAGAKPYSMVPDNELNKKSAASLTTEDYKKGVWYSAKMKLPAGPHSYYFTFSDGLQTANWPTRPDNDIWVYGSGLANDCVPGPYINSAPVLSKGAVTPGSGKQGTSFRYTVTYRDADGQRPYKGHVYIETSPGNVRKCELLPLDKGQLTPENIMGEGVEFYFDTSTVEDLAMATGQRRFYFEFSDDWGDPTNVNSKIEGEQTRYPQAADSWISGPEVVSNQAPRLTDETVKSSDGSSTPATVWNFEVTYSDANDDAPSVMKLFIGQLQRDGKTVIWDAGHSMLEKDPSDQTYHDGKRYYFQTRLGGVDNSAHDNRQYYYAYYASDGELMATYVSSSDSRVRSDAASAFYREELVRQLVPTANQYFTIEPKVAQRAVVNEELSIDLTDATDVLRIAGVYDTQDLGVNGDTGYTVKSFTDGILTVAEELPEPGTTLWVEYVSGAPVVGPVNIDQPDPSGILADAEIFVGTNPTTAQRLRLDAQKSGWTGETDGVDIGRYAVMRGIATDIAGAPSNLTVVPEYPNLIASVEGVYLTPIQDGDDPFDGLTNYYQPTGSSHFNAGDKLIPVSGLEAEHAGKSVLIRYSDMRFTYIQRGTVETKKSGATYESTFQPDLGFMKSNSSGSTDPTVGVLGVWQNTQREYTNYFDPWRNSYSGTGDLKLTQPLPLGAGILWARYYQSGQYHIDRSEKLVYSMTARGTNENLYATYLLGKKMPMLVGGNNPPTLTGGNISAYRGSRGTVFTYTVTYSDQDGPSGQPPSYVRVYVDGAPYDMTPESSGVQNYSQGARYRYQTTLSAAGSHAFHFEASDGTDTVFYDWYSLNNETRPETGQRVRDIDGPWINDPPTLSNVEMNPYPTASLGQVVDVSVDYADIDGDEPYFFSASRDLLDDGTPLGQDVSGSPRLWIGTGGNLKATYLVGTVTGFPSGDRRIIEVNLDPGYEMADDELVDNYLQVIPKNQQNYAGRLYLIKGNNGNTIRLSTKNVVADGLVVGDKFRVNGILMRQADPTDTNYTDGCKFVTTLPQLPEGLYRMRITARSREDKPSWLKESMERLGEQWLPYSDPEAQTPIDYLTELVPDRPEGNAPPILSGTDSDTISQGYVVDPGQPKKIAAHHITDVLSANRVALWDAEGETYNRLWVTNVFRNADSLYLSADKWRDGDGYYTPAGIARPYDLWQPLGSMDPVATDLSLSKSFTAISVETELVQLAVADVFAMQAIPDATDCIGELVGVFADPECTIQIDIGAGIEEDGSIKIRFADPEDIDTLRTNVRGEKLAFVRYKPAVKTLTNVEVNFSDGVIVPTDRNVMLGIAGVVGVYLADDAEMEGNNYLNTAIPYAPGHSGIRVIDELEVVNISYIAYPPVYVEFRGGHVEGTPAPNKILASGVPVMLNVNYRDADNDPPAFHDNVEGFLSVDIYNSTHPEGSRFLFAMPEPEPINFTSNVRFEQILQTGEDTDMLVPGESFFAFVASDGYCASSDYVWLPGVRPNSFNLRINHKPMLTAPSVLSLGKDTDAGPNCMRYALSVVYADGDGQEPEFVKARVRDAAGAVTDYILERRNDTTDYQVGELYTTNITLDVGDYRVIFVTSDGIQVADTLNQPMRITVGDKNAVPVISDYQLDRPSGKLDDTFVFTATYSDADGDSPLVTVGKVAQEGMTLRVTEANSKRTQEYIMKRVGSGTDFEEGVEYVKELTGNELKAALGWSGKTNYVFTVFANDGVAEATKKGLPATKDGPVLNVPYIKTIAVVDKDTKTPMTRAAAGREVLLTGTIAFPYTQGESAPATEGIRLVIDVPGSASIGVPVLLKNITLVTGPFKKEWIGEIDAKYALAEPNQDPAIRGGESVKLSTGGTWMFRVNWDGDNRWDVLLFDLNLDGANDVPDYLALSVGGPLRTVAVDDPGQPSASVPLIDMITPPMFIGNPVTADVGFVFGYERAIDMQIVRWDPASQIYRWYAISLPLEIAPGEAVWVKPKNTYPAQEVSAYDLDSGLLMSGNLGVAIDPNTMYRVISVTAKDYPQQTDALGNPVVDSFTGRALLQPCRISLKAGWNQFGNIFYNWKRDSAGNIVLPRTDVGLPLSSVTVSYHGVTKTLSEAKDAGWIRDYAWRYDAETGRYVLVSQSVAAAEKMLNAWAGYWIKALVNCELVIDPNAAFNVSIAPASLYVPMSVGIDGSGASGDFDVPPAPVFPE